MVKMVLDRLITFQFPIETPDGGGGKVKDWQNLPELPQVWAAVSAGGGGESMSEDRTVATGQTVFMIRNRSDINETHSILLDGMRYNIRNVRRQHGRGRFLEIETERGVA